MQPKRKQTTSSNANPCTNFLLKCTVCKMGVCHYNMQKHFLWTHENVQAPLFVEEKETEHVKTKTFIIFTSSM